MRLFFIIILVIWSFSFSFAQDEKVTSVSEGSKAILFSFSGLDNLNAGTFNGGIGGKYYLNHNLAIRVGIQLNSVTETIPSNADSTQTGRDGEASNFRFGINAAVEWHLNANRISPYIGGGLGYSSVSSESFPSVTWSKNFSGK